MMQWLDPGELVDRELELVAPHERWTDDVLEAVHHPLTQSQDPQIARWSRQTIVDFLRSVPAGRDGGDLSRQRYPGYHFWMKLRPPPFGQPPPALKFAGGVSLRVGREFELKMYLGHVGYHVFPPARGHHYAERAVRLLLPLARDHGMNEVWITVNPDNLPSRRTCERLGAKFIEIVNLPPDNLLYQRGETRKCRYLLRI
jgi:predicted acetyltransferase